MFKTLSFRLWMGGRFETHAELFLQSGKLIRKPALRFLRLIKAKPKIYARAIYFV
ncbi:MAG: hypothetical protein P1P64_06125 [Treponemataceae bacterium]